MSNVSKGLELRPGLPSPPPASCRGARCRGPAGESLAARADCQRAIPLIYHLERRPLQQNWLVFALVSFRGAGVRYARRRCDGDRGNVTRPFAEERRYIRVTAEGGVGDGRRGRGEAAGGGDPLAHGTATWMQGELTRAGERRPVESG